MLSPLGFVSPSPPGLRPASFYCAPIPTTLGPAVSQACLEVALSFFIPGPNDNHDGLSGLSRSQASLYPLPLGSTHYPRNLQFLGDSWVLALIRSTQLTNVLRPLPPNYYYFQTVYLHSGPFKAQVDVARLPFNTLSWVQDHIGV